MNPDQRKLEKPLLAYVLITISFVFGIVASSATGQTPRLGAKQEQVTTRLLPGHHQVRRRWILGVHADVTESGYLIRHVEHHSAASRIGLEPGDRIVTINGVQIGLIGHRTIQLIDTLEREGGHDGHVRLLIQNRRNSRLVSVKVQLRHPNQHLGH